MESRPIPHPRDAASWWSEVKASEPLLRGWLLDQYRGEATAAGRIEAFRDVHAPPGSKAHRLLGVIAAQERRHATWVAALLTARGLRPEIQRKAERYWPRTLPGLTDLATGCAVGAHAERMRLERIEVIARDPEAPEDIRQTFARILREERFHERAFRGLSTPEALEQTRHAHELGRLALGLSP